MMYFLAKQSDDINHYRIIYDNLNSEGFFFYNAFSNNIDWDSDTKNQEWGMSYLTDNWLKENYIKDKFNIIGYYPGRCELNQDVYVLQKKIIIYKGSENYKYILIIMLNL